MSAERGGQKSPLEVHDLVGASAKDEASPRTLDAGRRLLAALQQAPSSHEDGIAPAELSKKVAYSKEMLMQLRSTSKDAADASRPAELDYFTRIELVVVPVAKALEGSDGGPSTERRPRKLSEGGQHGGRDEMRSKDSSGASGPAVSAANKILASIRGGGGGSAGGKSDYSGGGGKAADPRDRDASKGGRASASGGSGGPSGASSGEGQWQRVELKNRNNNKGKDEGSNTYQHQRQERTPQHEQHHRGEKSQNAGGEHEKVLSAAEQRELFEKEREMIMSQRARGGNLDELDLLRGPAPTSKESSKKEEKRDSRQSFGGGFGDRYETTDEIANFHDETDQIMRELAGVTGKSAATAKKGKDSVAGHAKTQAQQEDDSWLTSALQSDLSLSLANPASGGGAGTDSGKSSSRLGKLLGLGLDSNPSSPVRNTASRPKRSDLEDDDDDVSLSLINKLVFDENINDGFADLDGPAVPVSVHSLGALSTPSKDPIAGLGLGLGLGLGIDFGSPATAVGGGSTPLSPNKLNISSLFSAAMQHGDGSGVVKESAIAGRNALAAAAGAVPSPSLQSDQRNMMSPPHHMAPPPHMMSPHVNIYQHGPAPQTMSPSNTQAAASHRLNGVSPRSDGSGSGQDGQSQSQSPSPGHNSFAFHSSTGKRSGSASLGLQGNRGRGGGAVMSAVSKMQLMKMQLKSPQPKGAGGASSVNTDTSASTIGNSSEGRKATADNAATASAAGISSAAPAGDATVGGDAVVVIPDSNSSSRSDSAGAAASPTSSKPGKGKTPPTAAAASVGDQKTASKPTASKNMPQQPQSQAQSQPVHQNQTQTQRINVMDLFSRAGAGKAAPAGSSVGAPAGAAPTATVPTVAAVPAPVPVPAAAAGAAGGAVAVNATRNLKAMLDIGGSKKPAPPP